MGMNFFGTNMKEFTGPKKFFVFLFSIFVAPSELER